MTYNLNDSSGWSNPPTYSLSTSVSSTSGAGYNLSTSVSSAQTSPPSPPTLTPQEMAEFASPPSSQQQQQLQIFSATGDRTAAGAAVGSAAAETGTAVTYNLNNSSGWFGKVVGVTSVTADHSRARLTEDIKESPQKLSSHPKAVDAVYFNGGNSEGVFMVAALARRPKGVFNGVLYLKHPSLGLLQLPRMPDTLLFGGVERWGAEGLTITPLKTMMTWAIKYKGQMRRHQPSDPETEATGGLVNVDLDITWAANFPHYDFDSDMHEGALCRSMAKEPWSREYFDNLRDAHQTHYEQMGRLHGQAVVDGQQYTIDLLSMRDHSYGVRREWRLLHRYALHMMHTEQGTQFNVGVVSQPITSSNLELGYVCWPGRGRCSSIARVHFDLWRHGERGVPPTDYAFSFAEGGQTHLVEVSVVSAPVFFMGWEWEARIVECFAEIKLDGVPGFGIVEYQYNSGPGDHRPRHLSDGDPDWTKTLNKG